MESFRTKQLADDQLEAFDSEFIDRNRRNKIKAYINRDFPSGEFSFLDIGGGNGTFADKILESYPLARGTVIDNSELLLSKNSMNSRKRTVHAPIEGVGPILSEKFDIIFMNFLLHHLVGSSYRDTRKNQVLGLKAAKDLLAFGGRISIFENLFDGLVLDIIPSHLIFQLTSSKILAPVIRTLGANTAGVGVCFLSKKEWEKTIMLAGLEILLFTDDDEFDINLYKRIFLHLGYVRRGHFWCASAC